MHMSLIVVFLVLARSITAQLSAETVTVHTPLTATGATVLATGSTVTFSLDLTTATVSKGPGTTVTLSAASSTTQDIPLSISSRPISSLAPTPSPCHVYGDPDIIGLGVRLGLYLQVISNLVIVYNSPKEGAASIVVTNIFMTAVLAAIIILLHVVALQPANFLYSCGSLCSNYFNFV